MSAEEAHPVDTIRDNPRAFAMFLALWARNALDDLHAEGQLTPDMQRLNTALRDSLYTALMTLQAARSGNRAALHLARETFLHIPPYWGLPKLQPGVSELLGQKGASRGA